MTDNGPAEGDSNGMLVVAAPLDSEPGSTDEDEGHEHGALETVDERPTPTGFAGAWVPTPAEEKEGGAEGGGFNIDDPTEAEHRGSYASEATESGAHTEKGEIQTQSFVDEKQGRGDNDHVFVEQGAFHNIARDDEDDDGGMSAWIDEEDGPANTARHTAHH